MVFDVHRKVRGRRAYLAALAGVIDGKPPEFRLSEEARRKIFAEACAGLEGYVEGTEALSDIDWEAMVRATFKQALDYFMSHTDWLFSK